MANLVRAVHVEKTKLSPKSNNYANHFKAKKKIITADGSRIDTVAHAAAERHYMFAYVTHASRESSLSP